MTKGKIVTFFQNKGARVHFNHTSLECPTLTKLNKGDKSMINLRYGIVEFDDMVRDLKYWETLLASSFMQRPHEVLTEGQTTDEMMEA